MSIIDQLRQATRDSGQTVNRIATETGIPQPSLHKFAAGQRGLSMDNLATLAAYLGLELRPVKKRGKK